MELYFEHEDGTLDAAIWNAIDGWRSSRRDYWAGADDESKQVVKFCEAVAAHIVGASEELSRPHRDLMERVTPGIVDAAGREDLVLEPIEHSIATWMSTEVRDAARRAVQLAALVTEQKPSREVTDYLRRLSRCYIAGFEPEAVVMCRAVVENSLTDGFKRKRVPMPEDDAGHSSMSTRLEAAVRFGVLTPSARNDAWKVWKRGSRAAHEDANQTKDVLGTIRLAMGVLKVIYG